MKFIQCLLMFFRYKSEKSDENIRYLLATEKGMLCSGVNNGVAEFIPSLPPQDEPKKAVGFSEFKEKYYNLK